jgi:hypothetical protein
MFTIVKGTKITRMRAAIARMSAQLPNELEMLVNSIGNEVVQQFRDAAPHGSGEEGEPSAGDSPGRLADSFYTTFSSDGAMLARVQVKTTQPTKLGYVRNGTGIYGKYNQRIVPVTKKALYWKGAPHPVRSVAGQKANDFIKPIVENYKVEAATRVSEFLINRLQSIAEA